MKRKQTSDGEKSKKGQAGGREQYGKGRGWADSRRERRDGAGEGEGVRRKGRIFQQRYC